MWISQLLSNCSGWNSPVSSLHAISVNSEMGQHLHCLSGPIVSSVRQAGLIMVKASLGLSTQDKLPAQLWWCDEQPWLSSVGREGCTNGESGYRRRCFPPHWTMSLSFSHHELTKQKELHIITYHRGIAHFCHGCHETAWWTVTGQIYPGAKGVFNHL